MQGKIHYNIVFLSCPMPYLKSTQGWCWWSFLWYGNVETLLPHFSGVLLGLLYTALPGIPNDAGQVWTCNKRITISLLNLVYRDEFLKRTILTQIRLLCIFYVPVYGLPEVLRESMEVQNERVRDAIKIQMDGYRMGLSWCHLRARSSSSNDGLVCSLMRENRWWSS